MKTIAKNFWFVIWFAALASIYSACGFITSSADNKLYSSGFEPPRVLGHIDNPDITEASGLVVSKCQPNVFWTHNDSGDGPFIYALGPTGENLGTWRMTNAENIDWEDIAERREPDGTCRLYIGEIGDNNLRQNVHRIYRVLEPEVTDQTKGTRQKTALPTEPAEMLDFSYADTNQNAETLVVHPVTGDVYVLTKRRKDPSGVYKIKPLFGNGDVQVVGKVADVQVPSIPIGLLTGGDISPDGRRLALCDYVDGYELTLPNGDNNFDDIWKQEPVRIDLGPRDTGEAIAYGPDDRAIFATTENPKAPLIEVRRK
ncbi:MAG TPA: hypothetical protein VEV84_03205 [Pyrinomonadaceae bacterium]|nr:hypothetical protein [Pyrinomonadaceae bacterium]